MTHNTTDQGIALANRCEQEEPTQHLEVAIGRYLAGNFYEWWKQRSGSSAFSRNIDAAKTLVPKGWICALTEGDPSLPNTLHYARVSPQNDNDVGWGIGTKTATGRTLALALSAAALLVWADNKDTHR